MKGLEDNLIKVLCYLTLQPHFVSICASCFFTDVGRVRDEAVGVVVCEGRIFNAVLEGAE